MLLDEIKRQKKIVKMQLTKLYCRLMTLMLEEEKIGCDTDCGIFDNDLCQRRGDKKNVDRSKDEIEKIIEATDKEIAAVKDFLFFLYRKSSSKEFLQAKSGPDQRDWKLEEVEESIRKKGDEIPLPLPLRPLTAFQFICGQET